MIGVFLVLDAEFLLRVLKSLATLLGQEIHVVGILILITAVLVFKVNYVERLIVFLMFRLFFLHDSAWLLCNISFLIESFFARFLPCRFNQSVTCLDADVILIFAHQSAQGNHWLHLNSCAHAEGLVVFQTHALVEISDEHFVLGDQFLSFNVSFFVKLELQLLNVVTHGSAALYADENDLVFLLVLFLMVLRAFCRCRLSFVNLDHFPLALIFH
jgi:hypothetical protein